MENFQFLKYFLRDIREAVESIFLNIISLFIKFSLPKRAGES